MATVPLELVWLAVEAETRIFLRKHWGKWGMLPGVVSVGGVSEAVG